MLTYCLTAIHEWLWSQYDHRQVQCEEDEHEKTHKVDANGADVALGICIILQVIQALRFHCHTVLVPTSTAR